MKKLKNVLACMLAATTMCGAVACGGGNNGNKTELKVIIYEGGYGYEWVYDSIRRFEAKYAEETFEEGKTGVHIEVEHTKDTNVNTMNSSAYDIYFTNGAVPRDFSQKGWLVDINDIVTEKIDERDGSRISIEDKIDENYRTVLKNRGDSHYYGLPYADFYSGLTLDKEAFDARKWYFAAPEETSKTQFDSPYGTGYFITTDTAKKSCGLDGVYGTLDDGLPTSVTELLILCARIKQGGYVPFAFPGGHKNYGNLLFTGLWSSLAGYEEIRAGFDYSGEVEVVTGFSDEPLFKGIDYIKKPITKKVGISEAEGYYSTQTAARYYAYAFMQICEEEGFFANISRDDNVSHTATMGRFLTNGLTDQEKIAMLVEGSYWYNEASDNGEVKKYQVLKQKQTGEKDAQKDVRWMPLPSSLDKTAEVNADGVKNKYTLTQSGNSFAVINARTKNKGEGVVNAAKKFLQFTYTDEELSHRTGRHGVFCTGVTHPVSAEDSAKLNVFQNSVIEVAQNAKLILPTAQNDTFMDARSDLKLDGKNYVSVTYQGREYWSVVNILRSGINARSMFELTEIDATGWTSYYKG